ncbi:MAG: hypothetical protein GF404_07085 [candidate division Zixibacteria bacterium]|nr:hypothetical protein [candidate division Zixibacteria bacterium]
MAMKKILFIYLAVMLAVGLMLVSCGERDNPAAFPDINERGGDAYSGKRSDGVLTYFRAYEAISDYAGWEFFYYGPNTSFFSKIYTPPNFSFQANKPYPILYLLHDFMGDENYYFNYMVQRLADSLIYEGEIKEFYIVTVDASTPYGGSWYTNNDFFGHFEDMVAQELISHVEEDVPQLNVLSKRSSRAIGGFGMGGYGALKIISKYPDQYSSVSTSNCAGMFEGDGSSMRGMQDLVSKVLEEQELTTPVSNFNEAFDTTFGWRNNMPYTCLFFSMAQAFSPHPTDTNHARYADSTSYLPFFGFDLPFDYNGNMYAEVWDSLWLKNDLDNILPDASGHFDSIAVYMEYSDTEQFYFNEQAQAVMALMDNLGIEYSSATYSGYDGYPASNKHFIYDRLIHILKFHSEQLSEQLEDN